MKILHSYYYCCHLRMHTYRPYSPQNTLRASTNASTPRSIASVRSAISRIIFTLREYEASKMAYRDIKNSIDTAKREGKEEGLAEGMEKGLAEGLKKGLAEGMEKGMNKRSLEIARKMLANGMDAATVMEITGLSESQLQQLKG